MISAGVLSTLRGRAIGQRLRQPADALWDRRLGVHTFGYAEGIGRHGQPGWASHYQPLAYRDLFRGFAAAGLDRESVFTDLGCGLGRAVFAAVHAGAKAAIGVEFNPALAEAAETNRRRSRLAGREIRIVSGNAADHALGETTHVYMFHAFGPEVIAAVFDRARADRRARGAMRPLTLIYANPVHDDAVAALGWFRRVALLPAERQWMSSAPHYETAIWRSTDV